MFCTPVVPAVIGTYWITKVDFGMGRRRVFISGSGRSGTTLLAKLIDSSPEVFYRHEPDKLRPNRRFPFLPEPAEYSKFQGAAARYLDQIFEERLPFVVGKRPLFPKAYRSPIKGRLFAFFLSALWMAEKARFQIPVPSFVTSDAYLDVVKSVTSVSRVPLFAMAAPEVKFIHIVRHPGAVVASLLRGIEQGFMGKEDLFEKVSQMSNARELPVAIEGIRNGGFALRTAYVLMVQNDKTFNEMSGCSNYLAVSYEDLCANMAERLAEICAFIGIRYDRQMMDFVDAMNDAANDSAYFSVVRNPVGQISSWENVLDKETTQAISELISCSRVGKFILEKYRAALANIPG